jgi:hypothetical protein
MSARAYGLGRIIVIFLLTALSFPFNISSQLSVSPCRLCHRDGRYMHLHIDENPLSPLPVSILQGSTYNLTLNVQNFCSTSKNNLMTNVTVILNSYAGHIRVDKPKYVIAILPVGTENVSWEIFGETSGKGVLEFKATATNPHNNLTLVDSLIYDLEVLDSSVDNYRVTILVTDKGEQPIANVLIRIGSKEIISDNSGIATLSLPQNNYSYHVTNSGFQDFNSSFTLHSDLFIDVKLTKERGEEIDGENLLFPFLSSPWFVIFLALSLGASGVGLGLLCMHGGNNMRSRFFIISTVAILVIFITIIIYVIGIRVPSPLITIFGANHSLIHWIGWIGIGYLVLFMTISVVTKRKAIKLYPKIFRIHVVGNLLATEFATIHFMHQITRSVENYPDLGTGIVLYFSIVGLALSGYGTAFRFFRTEVKKARFLHTSLAITLLMVVILHIIHGISKPF